MLHTPLALAAAMPLAECALVFFHGVLGDDAEGEVVRLPDEQAARQARPRRDGFRPARLRGSACPPWMLQISSAFELT